MFVKWLYAKIFSGKTFCYPSLRFSLPPSLTPSASSEPAYAWKFQLNLVKISSSPGGRLSKSARPALRPTPSPGASTSVAEDVFGCARRPVGGVASFSWDRTGAARGAVSRFYDGDDENGVGEGEGERSGVTGCGRITGDRLTLIRALTLPLATCYWTR